ncbi:MAG TPA: hypothetical protein VG273_21520 [Bryobacteraceae bacterium]|jgi:hypothetical protein|nr:hypothetical protein [Bryobacteraceae bacterium]
MHYARDVRRYLCSDLVVMKTKDGESIVNLEEISAEGAVFESEKPVESGLKVELRGGEARFQGFATSVQAHEFGWRVEVDFSPLTPWSPALYMPKHLLDLPEGNGES